MQGKGDGADQADDADAGEEQIQGAPARLGGLASVRALATAVAKQYEPRCEEREDEQRPGAPARPAHEALCEGPERRPGERESRARPVVKDDIVRSYGEEPAEQPEHRRHHREAEAELSWPFLPG